MAPSSKSSLPSLVLLLLVWLTPFSFQSSGTIGFVGAMRRADVAPDGNIADDEEDDEDEEYEEYEEYEDDVHEPVSSLNTKEDYEKWANSEMSTAMWSIIDRGDTASLVKALEADPNLVYVRSEDGRGPLFWAYEYERYDMVKILLDQGADAAAVDVHDNTPVGLMGKDERVLNERTSQQSGQTDEEYEDDEEYEEYEEDEYDDEAYE